VDPTIAAAWIGAGVGGGVGLLGIAGTVVTSVVSSNNTRKATERTVEAGAKANRATLAAAREERLWDKRAAAYEENLTGLLYRQAKRQHDLREFQWDEHSEQRLKKFFDSYDPPGWFEAQGRLVAYAADDVLDASEAARRAHGEVQERYAHQVALQETIKLAQASGRLVGMPNRQTMNDAREKTKEALQDAEAADYVLIKAIREALRSKPEAVMVPAIVAPVKRRRFWHRNRE
jgi:hypothetical protein